MQTLESLRESVTEGVSNWLSQLVQAMPDLAPRRTDPAEEDPALSGLLQRFVHDVVTTNPVTRDALPSIQVLLIELALDCGDWDALARDPRFRQFDWSRARFDYP